MVRVFVPSWSATETLTVSLAIYHVCSMSVRSLWAIASLLFLVGCGPLRDDDVCVYKRNGKTVCRRFVVLGPNVDGSRERMARSCGGNTISGGTDANWQAECPMERYVPATCGCVVDRNGAALGINERYVGATPAEVEAACRSLAGAFACDTGL